jgi:predicted AlkP superfamily pyrophosphatase or phosphodiesterase
MPRPGSFTLHHNTMTRTAILDVVGLTSDLIGDYTPTLRAFTQRFTPTPIEPAFPAVTCTAQSTYLTGTTPARHGIVGNGWYDRTLAEVQFWKQSNHLVGGEKLWEVLRRVHPGFTCAKLFWWYNMYSSADYSITPRPMYPADGRKVFDIHTWPYSIRTDIKKDLGEFPFAGFWGPAAGKQSPQGPPDCATRWIAESAKWIESKYSPSLALVYLPHLDYNLQRHGTTVAGTQADGQGGLNSRIIPDLQAIDAIVSDLLTFYSDRGVQVIILSEYGIENVDTPIHLNRIFREKGWLVVKDELGLELLDPGASRVFAVADHQVAHVYVNDGSLEAEARDVMASVRGVEQVLASHEKQTWSIDHPRAGDLIAIARSNAWFTYYYWFEDARAPDFARCVDIHRKPGYDPVELFTDPALSRAALKAKIGWRLLQKKLGVRMLMDLIPLDATLVRGSHGARPARRGAWPLLAGPGVSPGSEAILSGIVRERLIESMG